MGYRSQVVLAISKHLTPFLHLATSKASNAEALVFKDHDTFDRDYGGDKSWLLVWDDIKWYESYDGIAAIQGFVDAATCDEYEFEIDGEAQNSSEHIRFVRIGEETDDNEVQGFGFWDIGIERSISY
tara:strand:- start:1312 stop:1692 length:381 start_codon:yes stop_codon:yes gene_type:complete